MFNVPFKDSKKTFCTRFHDCRVYHSLRDMDLNADVI